MTLGPAQQEPEGFIDDRAAAKRLGVSAAYLRKLRRLGNGPRFYRVGGRLVRYRFSDIEEWLAKQVVEPVGESAA